MLFEGEFTFANRFRCPLYKALSGCSKKATSSSSSSEMG